jgi:hypothetical protein
VRHGRSRRAYGKSGGFSLFEMVVVICSIVILYMVAEERLNQLPAAAERANFYAVLEQIKTGVNFEMVTRLARGGEGEIRELEGRNPMEFLIEPPSNYRGELGTVTDAVDKRNSWYFETSTGELVYVVGGSSISEVQVMIAGTAVNLGQIRFKLRNVYDGEEPGGSFVRPRRGQDEADRNWQALLLAPVREFTWERQIEQPVPLD